jgi:hypothetical protein
MNPIETYGPQGEYVAALIERAQSLTKAEARNLGEAWLAESQEVWNAAREAAWSAAYDDDARRTAAHDARVDAWNFFGPAGADPVAVAAETLSVRDLIGYGDFTWDDYDVLTGPWRRAIGPIHPDDEVAR